MLADPIVSHPVGIQKRSFFEMDVSTHRGPSELREKMYDVIIIGFYCSTYLFYQWISFICYLCVKIFFLSYYRTSYNSWPRPNQNMSIIPLYNVSLMLLIRAISYKIFKTPNQKGYKFPLLAINGPILEVELEWK